MKTPASCRQATNGKEMTYEKSIAQIKGAQANAGQLGHNEYGVPLHACNGRRHDEHYWAFIHQCNLVRSS
jgi:hypothetical protein